MFHVGQKVVCINDTLLVPTSLLDDLDGLKKGKIYTIRNLNAYRGKHPLAKGKSCVYLNEIVRPLGSDTKEVGFWSERFKPLEERKTDISVFEQLLNPKNHKELIE